MYQCNFEQFHKSRLKNNVLYKVIHILIQLLRDQSELKLEGGGEEKMGDPEIF